MAYATRNQVEQYLGVSYTSNTFPTSTAIEEWLDDIQVEIDNETKTSYDIITKSDVIIDISSDTTTTSAVSFDGTRFTQIPATADLIQLPDKDVVSLTTVEINRAAPQATPVWEQLNIGLGGDVRLHKNSIQILRSGIPVLRGTARFKVTYNVGNPELAPIAKWISIYKVALRVMMSQQVNNIAEGSQGPIRIGDISIDNNSGFSLDFIESTQRLLDREVDKLGTHNTYVI